MILLVASFGAFTAAALMGLWLAINLLKGKSVEPGYVHVHLLFALLGASAAIVAAIQGDTRVYINIVLVVIIAALGFIISRKRRKTGVFPKGLFAIHAALAVTCYALLGAITFNIINMPSIS